MLVKITVATIDYKKQYVIICIVKKILFKAVYSNNLYRVKLAEALKGQQNKC